MVDQKQIKFIFVRHGEAEHNLAFRKTKNDLVFCDIRFRDAPLTDEGIQQSKVLAKRLAEEYPGPISIWSSPLTRCIQTAEEIFGEVNSQDAVVLHDGLLEYQNIIHICNIRMTRDFLKEKFTTCNYDYLPETCSIWRLTEPDICIRNRMRMTVQMMTEANEGIKTFIVVSHKNSLFSLLEKALGNCEYAVKTYEDLIKIS